MDVPLQCHELLVNSVESLKISFPLTRQYTGDNGVASIKQGCSNNAKQDGSSLFMTLMPVYNGFLY